MPEQQEIQLIGIKKSFRMGEIEVPVLYHIDLQIYRGEMSVIFGPSGSGKSTLLNIIGGVDRPSEGEIRFDDIDLAKIGDRELTEYRRLNVGFVFQFYNLVGTLTARENIEVATEIALRPMDPDYALRLVELQDYRGHFPAQLSGGQQQRVAIARALAKNPRLMLLDEPTGALDARTGRNVLDLLCRLNRELGTTMVIITHAMEVSHLAHRIIHLKSGVIESSHVNKRRLTVEEIDW